MLETAPSLSIFTKAAGEGEEEREINGLEHEDANLVRSATIGNKVDGTVLGSGDFSFNKANMDLINEERHELGGVVAGFENLGTEEEEEEEQLLEPPNPPLYPAAGLGVSGGCAAAAAGDFEVDREYSEYYREFIEEYTNHRLILRNCANLLQSKGDLQEAEYYHSCATQADPGDGEILSRYAQWPWELYQDHEKVLPYFERAVQTAPDDSNVMAAYAKFLWEVDDDRYEELRQPNHHESKRDLKGAEEYYSQAILADPQDGKILSQYAKLIWEFYHDDERAASYFEKAIEAAPGDSDVLAAYASFLWTIDGDEVDNKFNSLSERLLAGCTDV